MTGEIRLKERLELLAQDKFQITENAELAKLIPAMLAQIGSTDSHLRDDLIYTAFFRWIVSYQAISQIELHEMWQAILSEAYLFHKIGEKGTDSVFRRSFSVLLLALLLYAHRNQPYLSRPEILRTKDGLLRYLSEEGDRRGFVAGKGWAHATAHAADALDELAHCGELATTDLTEILGAIQGTIGWQEQVYGHGEEERLATAVIAVIQRGLLSNSEITRWINDFADPVLSADAGPQKIILRSNCKNFLQSLYFRLEWENAADELLGQIDQTLRTINPHIKEGES